MEPWEYLVKCFEKKTKSCLQSGYVQLHFFEMLFVVLEA